MQMMMTKNLKNISRGMNLKFVIGVLIKGKTMKKYIFDVPCFYVYEVEAETEDKAREITNDLQHCKMIADHNSSFWGGIVFWIESPTADTQHESIYRKCLINRGHSVLN